MAITKEDVITLMNQFHDVVMFDKGTAVEQTAFFLYPEPRIFIPHGRGCHFADELRDPSETYR